MKDEQYYIKSTNRVIKEPVRGALELIEYVGINEKGEACKMYVYRVEKINKADLHHYLMLQV